MYTGLAQAAPPSSEEARYRDLLGKIQQQLQRKFTGPDDPRLYERRKELHRLFDQVPQSYAKSLHQMLLMRDDELAKKFNRLHSATRNELLGVLMSKFGSSTPAFPIQPTGLCNTPVEQAEGRCIEAKTRWQTYQSQAFSALAKPWHYFLTREEYLRFHLARRAALWREEQKKEKADLKSALGFESILFSPEGLKFERRSHPITAAIVKLIRQMLLAGEVRKSRSEATKISNGVYAITHNLKGLIRDLRYVAPNKFSYDAEVMVIGRLIDTVGSTADRIRIGASYSKGWEDHWYGQLKLLNVGLIRLISPAAARRSTRTFHRPTSVVSHKLYLASALLPGAILTLYLKFELKYKGDIPGIKVALKEGGPEVNLTGKPGGPSASVTGKGLSSTLVIEGAKDWSTQLSMSSGGDLNFSLKNSNANFSVSGKMDKASLTAQLPELNLGEFYILKVEPEIEVTLLPTFWKMTQTQSPESVRAFRKALLLSPATWLAIAPAVIALGAVVIEGGIIATGVELLKQAPGVIIRLAPAI